MPLGAHVSTSGGLSNAIGRAQAMGAECMQVFLCAPQQWKEPNHADDQVERFGQLAREAAIGPNFAHAIYLINLASSDPTIRERSIGALSSCARWADRIGLDGVIVHVGSSKGQPLEEAERNVVSAVEAVLANSARVPILLENAAGSGNTLGATFGQLGALLDALGRDPRLGVCVDTAHAFASGYDWRTTDGFDAALAELERAIGFDRLLAIHANDSKVDVGAARDRHENIGQGFIGEDAFARLLTHPSLTPRAWLLEVPGYGGDGPDLESINTLRRLAGREAAVPAAGAVAVA